MTTKNLKYKKPKKNNNNDTQIQTLLYCGNKRGRPLPQAIADLRKSEPKGKKSVLPSELISKFYTGMSKLTLPRVTTDAVKWRSWRRYLIKDGLRRRVTARNQRLTAF